MSDHADILKLKTRLDVVERMLARVELRPLPGARAPLYVQIIRGQTISGVPMIQYIPDPLTASAAFDTTSLTLDAGLGVGNLYGANGLLLGPVLVRHNYAGFTDPIMAGVTYLVGVAISVPVTQPAPPAAAIPALVAYPIIRG